MFKTVPRPVVILGLAGLAPQAICLALALQTESHYFAVAAGCFYAALILSFLGGLWWMAGLLAGRQEAWIYIVAVLPSLGAWMALLPWCVGWRWPGPSLAGMGLALLLSPLVDAALGRRIAMPAGWLQLRGIMAGGLGVMTLIMAAI